MPQPHEVPQASQAESDSAPGDDIPSDTTPPRAAATSRDSFRGRTGLSTPARIALGESASRLAAPSPVVDPNGLGWPGRLVSVLPILIF